MMLACVSPGDSDLEETLNTLKYANRARQIRNKPVIAQDPMQARIAELTEHINVLQARLSHYEAGGEPLPSLVAPPVSAVQVPSAAPGTMNNSGSEGNGAGGPSAADSVLLRRVAQLNKENDVLKQRIASLLRGGGHGAEDCPKGAGDADGEWSVTHIGLVSMSSDGDPLVALQETKDLSGSEARKLSNGSSSSSDSADAREECAFAQEEMEAECVLPRRIDRHF